MAKKRNDSETVDFVMNSMRRALLSIADVPFKEMNKNMCISMRAIARASLKECVDALKEYKDSEERGDSTPPLSTKGAVQ